MHLSIGDLSINDSCVLKLSSENDGPDELVEPGLCFQGSDANSDLDQSH